MSATRQYDLCLHLIKSNVNYYCELNYRLSLKYYFLFKSSGDLENEENIAATITRMLQTAAKIAISGDRTQTMKRMSGRPS